MNRLITLFKNAIGLGLGNERTNRVKKNIFSSFIIKGLNIIIGLAIIPLTIDYLNPAKYGIWITLSSIVTWFGFFDIGLGQGLRNRFAEAIALGQHELAKTYVSTTYAILTIIVIFVILIFYLINPFLNWSRILNTGTISLNQELRLLALIVFSFFCLQFIFKLISTILTADQRPAKASLFDFLSKLLSLIIIYILTRTTKGSLIYLGLTLSGIPVLVLLISSIWFFNGKYKPYKPSFSNIDFSQAKHLLKLGVNFFLIEIAVVLLYQTNNIIISQLFGPAEVTPYNVALKYFSILTMTFSIIVTPFWSAFTDAWVKNEKEWIRSIMNRLIKLWGVLVILGILMFIFSKWVYNIWVGEKIIISYSFSGLILLYIILNAWGSIYSYFLNGVGKIKLQLYVGISAALINIPLAIYLGYKMGIKGVLISNILVKIVGIWIYPLQYSKIISNSAKGLWNN